MFYVKYLFYSILLYPIVTVSQLNLYYTDGISENYNDLQHNCLHTVLDDDQGVYKREMIYYCMSELPSKFNVNKDDFIPKFTFNELSKQNISSQQLYLWSAPIDLIERYQFYLNQLLLSNESSLSNDIFYNCTMPRFGPMCQYELYYNYFHHTSLNKIIHDFYNRFEYKPINLTCYEHLQCNRGYLSTCLDWSEICNGQIDCIDGGLDEKYCWQLEINECKENEYRCKNGQCIAKLFSEVNDKAAECIDGSDIITNDIYLHTTCHPSKLPTIACEDITCEHHGLTSSCYNNRVDISKQTILSITKDNSIYENCSSVFKCLYNISDSKSLSCDKICPKNLCIKIFNNICSDVFHFPNIPILFGDIYFIFMKNISFYICYNNSQYDNYLINISRILFQNMKCINYENFLSSSSFILTNYEYIIKELYINLKKYHLSFNYNSSICNRSNMYQCNHSIKCISIYRLLDGKYDCPYMDDENITSIENTSLIEQIKSNIFKCELTNKYIPHFLVGNLECDCGRNSIGLCEDEDFDAYYIQKNILFQHICDGFNDLSPILIDERNETDETECEQWKCNNIYTHCNGIWNCPHGEDEINCFSHLTTNCSSNQHLCVSPDTNQLICLSIDKANDGKIDCLGATDEPTICGTNIPSKNGHSFNEFYCRNQKYEPCIWNLYLCDGNIQCEHGDDEQFCTNQTNLEGHSICARLDMTASNVERFLCTYETPKRRWTIIHFKLHEIFDQMKNIENSAFSTLFNIQMINELDQPRCHRGLNLRVWLNDKNNSIKNTCLCLSSYYGSQCQYQNQRISLTLRFRPLSDSYQTLFSIIVSLIDNSNHRIIHSYEQITYLSTKHCKTKFSMYLLYSTRPKNSIEQYAIHIDFYEKISLNYRGSVLLPIKFSFLPVHRLAFIIDIPKANDKTQNCTNKQCINGKCIKYWNYNNSDNFTFCKCNQGWSGKYCTIQHICTCSSDSLCIGRSANNRSICICPINKFGPRCLLTDDRVCQTNDNITCKNNGQCIYVDNYLMYEQKFICLCQKGYSGDQCQISDNKLILSFTRDIVLSQQIFIHFINVSSSFGISRSTTFRTISFRQTNLTIHWSKAFNLVFIELFNRIYYLITIKNISNPSIIINKTINPSDRCPYISEILSKNISELNLIRRIKYYHLPCQNLSLNISCFYDEIHLCLCYNFTQQRLANCFKFQHNLTFNCSGKSVCENDAHCLQDEEECPTRSICMCQSCFYGKYCQFQTSGFGFSLDGILGYHIESHLKLNDQPFIIKMSLSLTVIFIVAGLINSIFSMMTFRNKSIREIGCGLYLLSSSITTLLIIIIFGLKFFILLLSQMTIISNRSFLSIQCYLIDFILRICLQMEQWLNACVATERAYTTIKGARFNRKKSKRRAILIIIFLLIINIVTSIHDPISRRLIDEESNENDNNMKRTWCIATYSSTLQIYNYIMHTLNFLGPFLINLISAILLIIKKSQLQLNLNKQQAYRKILRKLLQEHKHLLTAPIILVILGIPRLIITFSSKCMKSPNDAWLFLCGYFISFIPSMLTFLVFILPSKFYKKEFHKSVAQFKKVIRQHLYLNR